MADYKLKVIDSAEEHGNRGKEWYFGPPLNKNNYTNLANTEVCFEIIDY